MMCPAIDLADTCIVSHGAETWEQQYLWQGADPIVTDGLIVLFSHLSLPLTVCWFFVHAVLTLSEPGAYKVKKHLLATQAVVQASRIIAFASGESVPRAVH